MHHQAASHCDACHLWSYNHYYDWKQCGKVNTASLGSVSQCPPVILLCNQSFKWVSQCPTYCISVKSVKAKSLATFVDMAPLPPGQPAMGYCPMISLLNQFHFFLQQNMADLGVSSRGRKRKTSSRLPRSQEATGKRPKKQTQLPTPLVEPSVEPHPDQCPEAASQDEHSYPPSVNPAAVCSPQPGPDMAVLVSEAVKSHLQAAGLLPASPTTHHEPAPQPQPSFNLQPTSQPANAPQPQAPATQQPQVLQPQEPSPNFAPLPGTSSFNRLTYIRPIDANIPPPVKAKIWQGEAINLASLLAPPVDEDHQNALLQMDESGNIGMGSANKKNKIHSIVQWNEAWRIYSFVMLSNPALSPDQKMSLGKDLFQYMDYVNNLYSLQADWQYYDRCFRSYKQYNDVPFACFDPELKDEAINRAKKGGGVGQKQHVRARPQRSAPAFR